MKAACLTEHFLSANEAQSKGFIDSVISDKCYSIKMMQITKRYKILKTLEGIWYDNIIKKLKSIGIIK